MDDLEFEIEIVTEVLFENEQDQLDSLYKTFDRIINAGRIDLFNNTVLKCIDNAEKQSLPVLLVVATWAKKIKNKVPLYKFLIGIIKDELEKRNYKQEKIDRIIFGLL